MPDNYDPVVISSILGHNLIASIYIYYIISSIDS